MFFFLERVNDDIFITDLTVQDVITIRKRARYSEVDRMGFVYYGRYLAWFEEARVEWMRARGIVYKDLEDAGIYLPVAHVRCDYHRPVEYDQEADVQTWVSSCASRRVVFDNRVTVEGKKAVSASITLICMGEDRKIKVLPDPILDILKKSCQLCTK